MPSPSPCLFPSILRTKEYLPRLARVWNTPDVETHSRKPCSLNLAVHAEMQLDRKEAAMATGQLIENSNSISVLAMVFHFMRVDDVNKQILLASETSLIPLRISRRRVKLLEILKDDDECGISFQEGQHFRIVNNRIWMTNEL
ncbi:hypothetical protein ABVK25_004106 [Lepraria finkii]|uniref:Uncharacterized protein n=1 Tax=Lepraria finkii TaxID=1340010 RepID=A0ABR4BEL9_9LECA